MVACHLMIEEEEALFIDVGTAPAAGSLLEEAARRGLQPEKVRYIILTHIHLDHAGGASQLMQLCPEATLLVHPKGAAHMIDPDRLVKATEKVYGEKLFRELYGEIGPIDERRVKTVSEGFRLDFNGRPLHFYDTPGHARHHCCIWDPKSGGLFSGDTCGMAYPFLQKDITRPFLIPATAPTAFEPDEMIKSIRRLMELNPDSLYLPHFGPVAANRESIGALIDLIEEHERLATAESEFDHQATFDQLLHIFFESYLNFGDGALSRGEFRNFLAGDIEINVQGIAARQARLNKNKHS
ncbi:MAG: MBL fold metallo-hydrolase [Desulfocapsaceae bacterium]